MWNVYFVSQTDLFIEKSNAWKSPFSNVICDVSR